MRIAIVHDYLNQKGGAEKVVGVLHQMYPDAPIYTLFVEPGNLWPSLHDAKIFPSILQHFPFIRRHFKLFFWLYPLVMPFLVVDGSYDIVISSSSAYAKGFGFDKTSPPIHLCYCYTPMRFAWDFERYMKNESSSRILRWLAGFLVPSLRKWDLSTTRTVDQFISISSAIQSRISQVYGRDSRVIYPPVEVPEQRDFPVPDSYFLVVSRLVSYKRIDLAVQACSDLGVRLLVIGQGPDRSRLEKLAGSSVRFIGWQSDFEVQRYMTHCKALIFPGEEDFGITPVEVNTLGRPVVAYARGGALDTITDGVNGVFFSEHTVSSLQQAIRRIDGITWDSEVIHEHAKRFGVNRFRENIKGVVDEALLNRK